MNELDVVRVKETVMVTPNFENDPIEIKAGWRGTIVAQADTPTPCIEFNEEYPGRTFSGGLGRDKSGSRLGIKMNKII
jgi:hypothetical protein